MLYQLEMKSGTHQFHRDYLPSYIWGFNGKYPGPTVLNAYGVPTIVRFKNSLPTSMDDWISSSSLRDDNPISRTPFMHFQELRRSSTQYAVRLNL